VSAPTRTDRPLRAALLMLLASALFALMNFEVKALTRRVPWHEVAAARGLLAAFTLWLFARARGVSLSVSDRKTQWRRTIAGTLSMGFSFYAISRLPLGDAVTIGNLTPLLLALFSGRVLGERAGASVWIAALVGLLGVATLVGAHFSLGAANEPSASVVGWISSLAAVSFATVAMVQLRMMGGRESAEAVALHFAFWAGVAAVLVGLGHQVMPTPSEARALLVAGVSGAFAQLVMTRAYAFDQAARVSAMGYSGIVFSFALEAIAARAWPDARRILGAGLVIGSGLLLLVGAMPRRAARATSV
jgi:drug/metabolite transporter (DMT)-like permease